ncbi:MAG: hypothetical protein JO197_13520 [Acidobacteria bacterium]|nr:hypothetical protein [Acidobacteriota bacterium]MBV9477715.1 hypothetical protein [Acidobacteriota bacterium]
MRWLDALRVPPPPLRRGERLALLAVFLVVTLTRFLSRARAPLDWDESIFATAVRSYDVVLHHPHPPGYPLFIAAAKLVHLVVRPEFRALQTVVTLAAILLFPAAFTLARELRFRFAPSLAAATLLAFLPSVWYYGGTALSDIPALALILCASSLLLRGARDPRAFIAGMLVCGLAAAIRPHLVLVAAVPALLALRNLRVRQLAAGVAAFVVVVGLAYGGAALSSSSVRGFLVATRNIETRVTATDSYRNPARPSLRTLAPHFFLTPFGGGISSRILLILGALALLDALLRRRAAVLVLLLMFVPIAVFSWLMLDATALTRYALAYAPLYAFLAAHALAVLGDLTRNDAIVVAATLVLTILLARWTAPALRTARTQLSPPAAAMQWVRTHVPRGRTVYVDNSLEQHATHLLPDYRVKLVFENANIPATAYAPGNVFLYDGFAMQPDAQLFRFDDDARLRELARPIYLETTLIPLERMIRFGDGWYSAEHDATGAWIWMQPSSTALLPPLPPEGILTLTFDIPPRELLPHTPIVTLRWNGVPVDRLLCTSPHMRASILLPSRNDAPNELRIDVDTALRPADHGFPDDTRTLALRVTTVTWERPGAPPAGRRGRLR